MTQKFIAAMTGYKATNADMTCKGHKFELGRWYEVPEVKMCEKGFHFCVHPSGVYSYYTSADVRVFRCEAEHILEVPTEAGADFKLVAKRIRLVEEVTPGSKTKRNTGDRNTGDRNTGNGNTGDWNTGDWNTGDRNTGDRNTGNRNTGDWNTGDWNTGDRNTGNRNTGNRNTGNRNTGYWNTGHLNTGNWNTGYWNTGHRNTGNGNTGNGNTGDWNTGDRNTGNGNTGNGNTGNRNTGNGNATNYSSGFFCVSERTVFSFDVQTEFTRQNFLDNFPEVHRLCELLKKTDKIVFSDFKNIPGITPAKLLKLHKKHLAALEAQ